MNVFDHRTRSPLKRENAHAYILLMLLSFALSVVLIRLFLKLTGFPTVGRGDLHIAHVLWGGLLLFLAGLLPLILANRWVSVVTALLNGIGVGLFIDEVGKFITQNNDYFSPLAAPIIYGLFLFTVLIYLWVRRRPAQDPRSQLYRSLDRFQEMLDHDLNEQECALLRTQLGQISQSDSTPDMAQFGHTLLDYFEANLHQPPDAKPGFLERLGGWLQKRLGWLLLPARLKPLIMLGLLVSSLAALSDPLLVLLGSRLPGPIQQAAAQFIAQSPTQSPQRFTWFLIELALETAVGFVLLVAGLFFVTGRERSGVGLGYMGLLVSLTTANLLTFYFDQFGNVLLTVIQLVLLLGLSYYRRHNLALDDSGQWV